MSKQSDPIFVYVWQGAHSRDECVQGLASEAEPFQAGGVDEGWTTGTVDRSDVTCTHPSMALKPTRGDAEHSTTCHVTRHLNIFLSKPVSAVQNDERRKRSSSAWPRDGGENDAAVRFYV
jgi:hypothetical protein